LRVGFDRLWRRLTMNLMMQANGLQIGYRHCIRNASVMLALKIITCEMVSRWCLMMTISYARWSFTVVHGIVRNMSQ